MALARPFSGSLHCNLALHCEFALHCEVDSRNLVLTPVYAIAASRKSSDLTTTFPIVTPHRFSIAFFFKTSFHVPFSSFFVSPKWKQNDTKLSAVHLT